MHGAVIIFNVSLSNEFSPGENLCVDQISVRSQFHVCKCTCLMTGRILYRLASGTNHVLLPLSVISGAGDSRTCSCCETSFDLTPSCCHSGVHGRNIPGAVTTCGWLANFTRHENDLRSHKYISYKHKPTQFP